MNDKRVASVSWSFWVIGVLALLWNVMGVKNFLMQTNPEVLSGYPDAARALVESRPAWATGAFAIAVFGGALGCILLLFKKSAAFFLFVASLLGVIVTNIHTFRAGGSTEIWVGSVTSMVVAALLIWYSKQASWKGSLS
jgi:hypothetical protein